MRVAWEAWGTRIAKVTIALACTVAALFLAVTIATSTDGGSDSPEVATKTATDSGSRSPEGVLATSTEGGPESPSGGDPSPTLSLVSTPERVLRHEALPCTRLKDPINFEIFSAGPSVADVPLNTVTRRCGGTTPIDEPPANFVNYIYGDCEIAEGATGCAPPLQIQTWPACQRALSDYTFEGKPMPYRRLPSRRGAEVVEIQFEYGPRIEVYTKTSTIVIFAKDPLAEKAVALLQSQENGNPPATQADELKGAPEQNLEPPTDGATEGELQCQS
jgi:hypothetical protein